jgi:hypothetical protein
MSKNGQHVVIEWAPFTLAEGVSEEQLLRASSELQVDFLAKQRGFVRRELLRGEDGRWVDLVYWADQASADEAMRRAMESSTCRAYFHLMAGAEQVDAGAGVLHFRRVASYE